MVSGKQGAELLLKKSMSYMFPILSLLLLAYMLQPVSCASAQASVTALNKKSDGDILLGIKASLSQKEGFMAEWNPTTDFCHWPGVTCSLKHKDRVTVLDLSSQGLSGTINPSIGNLTFLRVLDLSSNKLHGQIPPFFSHMTRLQHLNLSYNSLDGEITTQFKNCTSLQSIELSSNWLTGDIPAWLGGLSSLKSIRLIKNNFSGIIPQSLGNLSSLQKIYLISNQLVGTIPDGLGRLRALQTLALSGNHLSGTLPITLLNLSELTHFSVTMNELSGMLPSEMGNHLRKLYYLFLGMNHFTGSLPASLANATEMYLLDISANNLTGTIPPDIGKLCPGIFNLEGNQLMAKTSLDWGFLRFLTNCTRLQSLDLQKNMLGAMLPSSIANLSAQLHTLYLGYNEISGKIPFGISNLVGLTELQFSYNRFSGVIPNSIGRLNLLEALGFENNQLTGFIPSSLGNLTRLLRLYTDNNEFEGPLPICLGGLQRITVATFKNNKFTGPLPVEIFNLSSLSYGLDLSGNYFIGPLPPEVGNLKKLAYLYISRNNLSGPLPDALSNCQSLIELRLYSNSFNGSIPASISRIRGLMVLSLMKNTLSGAIPQEIGMMGGMKELYLSHNNLTGLIPESFENMTSLYQLDLSVNHLEGKVPSHGVFSNVTGFSIDGNLGLCGGILELHLPPCQTTSMKRNKRKLWVIVKVIVPIVGTILCLTLVLISISLRKKPKSESTTSGVHFIDDKYPRVSYAELVQGTNGFDTNNLVGSGRYGSVYKCSLLLKNTMTTVAVKVFDLQQSGSSKSFIAECEALNKIRHRNLISVITCCSSSDLNQNDFKAIVFEFMPNGSLHRWLHLNVHASQRLQGLTLTQRLNIAVDVADALDYLHNNSEPPIVHCDLKPSNILLDQDLTAHVGDFGLAKILLNSASENWINSKSTTGIRGTIGYIAPEYAEGGQISPCGDIYSFGIVILELFTGMAPTHEMFRDGLTLQKHAENMLPGMLMKIVDPVLLSEEEAHASNLLGKRNTMEQISKVMLSITKLALSCSKQAPNERMCMRDAATEMHRIRDHHVKTMQQEQFPMQ